MSAQGRQDLLDVLDDRTETGSVVISGKLPVKTWPSYIDDPAVADAILDRLAHRSHRLGLAGEPAAPVPLRARRGPACPKAPARLAGSEHAGETSSSTWINSIIAAQDRSQQAALWSSVFDALDGGGVGHHPHYGLQARLYAASDHLCEAGLASELVVAMDGLILAAELDEPPPF